MPTVIEDKFGELLNQKPIKPFKPGEMVEGKIFSRTKNKIWIDLEGRTLGVIYGRELSADMPDVKEGDKIAASVLEPEDDEGHVVLSLRRADREKFWDELKKKYENGENFPVKVIDANKGGLMVETNDIRGFLPVSQLASDHYPRVDGGDRKKILDKLLQLVNTKLDVKIITFDKNRNNLIFSEKAAGDKAKDEAIAGLKIGDKIKGIISGVIDFGVFVRFGNIEGLVHISEISSKHVNDPKEVVRSCLTTFRFYLQQLNCCKFYFTWRPKRQVKASSD